MGYPRRDDVITAVFWSDVQKVEGVHFCGEFNGDQGRESHSFQGCDASAIRVGGRCVPAAEGRSVLTSLYEIQTETAAQAINHMVHDNDGHVWWKALSNFDYGGPEGEARDVAFHWTGGYAAYLQGLECKFAKGDRIYMVTEKDESTGEMAQWIGANLGHHGVRLISGNV